MLIPSLVFLARVAAASAFLGATCPDYESIRQPSVSPEALHINEIEGIWYLVATTEPTTKFCMCNVMNYSIYQATYLYTDTCFQDLSKKHTNVTIPLGGDLSYDPKSPGILHEAIKLFNHTETPKNPNMLFNVVRDSKGEVVLMHFYACLGRFPPIVGDELFSYLLYSRSPSMSADEIHALVAEDRKVSSVFQLDGYVVTAEDAWRQCGVLPPKVTDVHV